MDISWHFLTNVQHTYDREKKLVEKYDVSTTGTGGGGGEYPLQDGFGWTNGVTLKMLDLMPMKLLVSKKSLELTWDLMPKMEHGSTCSMLVLSILQRLQEVQS